MPYTRLVVNIAEICKLNHDEKIELWFTDGFLCVDQSECTAKEN